MRAPEHQVRGVGRSRRRAQTGGRGDRLLEAPLVVELAREIDAGLRVRGEWHEGCGDGDQPNAPAKPLQSMDLCVLTARHLI